MTATLTHAAAVTTPLAAPDCPSWCRLAGHHAWTPDGHAAFRIHATTFISPAIGPSYLAVSVQQYETREPDGTITRDPAEVVTDASGWACGPDFARRIAAALTEAAVLVESLR